MIGRIIKLVLIDVISASSPRNNGPSSIPPYPRVAMLAIAVPCEIVLSLPARENAKGMITAIPNPMSPKPKSNKKKESEISKIIEPANATNPE
jgi:hypothetical protein